MRINRGKILIVGLKTIIGLKSLVLCEKDNCLRNDKVEFIVKNLIAKLRSGMME